MGLTQKQNQVLLYIRNYISTEGYAPTQREIKDHFELKSYGSVQKYLKYLNEGGYLENDWNARRGLKVTTSSKNLTSAPESSLIEIPLLGDVAAGNPIEAIENSHETLEVPKHFLMTSKKRHFALKVKGESMIEKGIFDGDFLICQQQETAHKGEIVVALINNEATVKTYIPKSNSIELHPANADYAPIIINQGEFRIVGVHVTLLRKF